MLKTKKVNKKGFMLVETLIVGVFILAIFSLLYTNIIPLVGEYERLKNYDTVESTYIAYWGREIVLKGLPDSIYEEVKTTGFKDITDCSLYTERDAIYECSAYEAVNSIDKIYLTTYNLTDIKNAVDNDPTNTYKRDFTEYINYLPTYSKNSFRTPEYGYYRVIVEYVSNDVHKYGNMEARKGAVTNEEP